MSAYYIINYDITDPETFAEYPAKALALITRYDGEVLVSDTNAIAVEGKPRAMNAIVKFPSADRALQCYNDPEYKKIAEIRWRSTSNCVMVLAQSIESV